MSPEKKKPLLRGENYKGLAGKKAKRDGLKGIHFDRWGCSDATCNHEIIDRIGTVVCSEFSAYGENSLEGVEVRLEVFRVGNGWEASARLDMHPDKQFKTSHAAMKAIDRVVRDAFAQLTREDL